MISQILVRSISHRPGLGEARVRDRGDDGQSFGRARFACQHHAAAQRRCGDPPNMTCPPDFRAQQRTSGRGGRFDRRPETGIDPGPPFVGRAPGRLTRRFRMMPNANDGRPIIV